MKIKQTFITGQHHHAYKQGEKATVIGFFTIKPNEELEARPCFQVLYKDYTVDYVPLTEVENGNYTLS